MLKKYTSHNIQTDTPWDVYVSYCSPSVDLASASLPGCCSSNFASVARSIHTLHRCQTWAGGVKERTHIRTHACMPHTRKHTGTHTHVTHTHTRTNQAWAWFSDVTFFWRWVTSDIFNPDIKHILSYRACNQKLWWQSSRVRHLMYFAVIEKGTCTCIKRQRTVRYDELPSKGQR